MNIEGLQAEWKKDCLYGDDPGEDVLRGGSLHQKWLGYLTEFKIKLYEQQKRFAKMRSVRFKMFRKGLSKEEYDFYGWEPHQSQHTIGEAEKQLEGDPIMMELGDKVFKYEICVDYCSEVLKKVSFRRNDIQSSIEWKKFQAGA